MKYRSRTDIVQGILSSARALDGVTKTRIMYEAYLSHAQLKEYLDVVIKSGLLEHDAVTNRYRTAPKGLEMMETYEKMTELAGEARQA